LKFFNKKCFFDKIWKYFDFVVEINKWFKNVIIYLIKFVVTKIKMNFLNWLLFLNFVCNFYSRTTSKYVRLPQHQFWKIQFCHFIGIVPSNIGIHLNRFFSLRKSFSSLKHEIVYNQIRRPLNDLWTKTSVKVSKKKCLRTTFWC